MNAWSSGTIESIARVIEDALSIEEANAYEGLVWSGAGARWVGAPSAPTGTAENTEATVAGLAIGLDARPSRTMESKDELGTAPRATTTPRAWAPKGSSKNVWAMSARNWWVARTGLVPGARWAARAESATTAVRRAADDRFEPAEMDRSSGDVSDSDEAAGSSVSGRTTRPTWRAARATTLAASMGVVER
jgi:hypothetical protein